MTIALRFEGGYGDEKPGLWTVVQYYKDFTAGWRRARREEEQENEKKNEEEEETKGLGKVISPNVTLSTSNVSVPRLARRPKTLIFPGRLS